MRVLPVFYICLSLSPLPVLAETQVPQEKIRPLINKLGQELSDEVEESPSAAAELIKMGQKEAIVALISQLLQTRPSRESMGIIYSLHEFSDPLISEWIAELLGNLPQNDEQSEHYSMLTLLASAKASPESLRRISQLVESAPTAFDKDLLLAIISQASQPEALDTLIELAQSNELMQEVSVAQAALTALALRAETKGIQFSFEQLQRDTSEEGKALRASALNLMSQAATATDDSIQNLRASTPLLISIADGTSSFGKGISEEDLTEEEREKISQNPNILFLQPRWVAIGILGKIDDENAWSALRILSRDSDPNIAYLAKEALKRVRARIGHEPP